MQHQNTPKYSIERYIEPTRVFIAVLLVAAFWLAPVVFAPEAEPEQLKPLLVTSADACPFACVVCTSWDEDSWTKR